MSKVARARRLAAAAAFGGTSLAGLSAAGLGVLIAEARLARKAIGTPYGTDGPKVDGTYGAGPGEPIELALLGDSASVGLGVDDDRSAPGAVIATGLAALTGRRVHLTVRGVVGAETRHLDGQIDELLETVPSPDAIVIIVGTNDITHRTPPATSVRTLEAAVRRLRDLGAEVVVGTVPDLGTVKPLAQPLRLIAQRWSRHLAAAQTIAVVEAGGRSVSLADLLADDMATRPQEMFARDQFHPSDAGYARLAAALLPSVADALGLIQAGAQRPDLRRGEGLDDVAHAAVRAAAAGGTEVTGTDVDGSTRGPRGRWAVLLRRPATPRLAWPSRDDHKDPAPPTEDPSSAELSDDGSAEPR